MTTDLDGALVICGEADAFFPAKAGPTGGALTLSRTGFSREEAGVNTVNFAV